MTRPEVPNGAGGTKSAIDRTSGDCRSNVINDKTVRDDWNDRVRHR